MVNFDEDVTIYHENPPPFKIIVCVFTFINKHVKKGNIGWLVLSTIMLMQPYKKKELLYLYDVENINKHSQLRCNHDIMGYEMI